MSLTIFGSLTIFSVNLFCFKNEKGSVVNIGNINSPVNNTNITNNKILDENESFQKVHFQMEMHSLNCYIYVR